MRNFSILFFPNRGLLGDKIVHEPIVRMLAGSFEQRNLVGVEWSADMVSMMDFPVSPVCTLVLHEFPQELLNVYSGFSSWLGLVGRLGVRTIVFEDDGTDSVAKLMSLDGFRWRLPLWETLDALHSHGVFPSIQIPSQLGDFNSGNGIKGLIAKDEYVTMHIRNQDRNPQKNLSVEKCVKIGKEINRRLGKRVLLVGKDELGDITNEGAIIDGSITVSNNNQSIWDVAGIIKHARVHIGGDTGLTHLAAALGTKVISVERNTSDACGDFGPYSSPGTAIKLSKAQSSPEVILDAVEGMLISGNLHKKSGTSVDTADFVANLLGEKNAMRDSHLVRAPLDERNGSNAKLFASLSTGGGNQRAVVFYNRMIQHVIKNSFYIPVRTNSLGQTIELLGNLPVGGFSVASPFKVEVLRYVSELDEHSKLIGASNTIVKVAGEWKAFNTDWVGAIQCLKKATILREKKVLVLGAGGVSRAICYGLKMEGAKVTVAARRIEQAALLCTDLGLADYGLANGAFEFDAEIFVNATTIGSHDVPKFDDVSRLIPKSVAVVMDVVFDPQDTPFRAIAMERGCKFVGGWQMLENQAIEQIRLFSLSDNSS